MPIDAGGFGVDDSSVAPEGVGDFQYEVFLKDTFGFKLVEQGVDQLFVLGAIFVKVGGFEDNIAGVEAMLYGVTVGDGFAFG